MKRWLAAAAVLVAFGATPAAATHSEARGVVVYGSSSSLGGREVYAVWSVDPGGHAEPRRLTATSRGAQAPRWSPDGGALAFATRWTSVAVWDLDRRTVRRVASSGGRPAWSPDGSELAIGSFGGGTISIVRADGRSTRALASVPSSIRDVYDVDWSPNGRDLAFSASESFGHDACCVFAVRESGGPLRRVVAQPLGTTAWRPRWSPDGGTVAFTEIVNCRGTTCSGPANAILVSADGRNRRTILENAYVEAWSPTGQFLLVWRSGAEQGLYVVRLSNGELTRVLATPAVFGADWQPQCSASGDARANRLRGTPRRDVICGRGGRDAITGAQGRDRLYGAGGDDTIDARDGAFDIVGCGSGRDIVRADRADRIGVDCERIVRG